MAMQMQRAFNPRMLTAMKWYIPSSEAYDENNNWIEGPPTCKKLLGRLTVGNKFSQLEEGTSVAALPGGERTRDYKTLYCSDKYKVEVEHTLGFQGKYYRVLQMSNEDTFGFRSWLIEEYKNWSPS